MNLILKPPPKSPSVLRQLAAHRGCGRACATCHAPCPGAASDRLHQAIAHEVNQPLAAIALHAAAARKWLSRAEPDIDRALESLALIAGAGRQAGDIVRGLQRQAAGAGLETARVTVDTAVRAALGTLCWPLRRHGIAIDSVYGLDNIAIDANRVQLQQVVTNLLVNAIEALAARPQAQAPRIRVETLRRGDEVEIAVTDNGPGIAPACQARVVASLAGSADNRPGKHLEQTRGLGLAISAAIVRAHGGQLWFEPVAPHGVCFRLRMPMRRPAASARPAPINAYAT
jgi:C4-dicarboxylate-specific signal transduction histidine kinase